VIVSRVASKTAETTALSSLWLMIFQSRRLPHQREYRSQAPVSERHDVDLVCRPAKVPPNAVRLARRELCDHNQALRRSRRKSKHHQASQKSLQAPLRQSKPRMSSDICGLIKLKGNFLCHQGRSDCILGNSDFTRLTTSRVEASERLGDGYVDCPAPIDQRITC